jgi:hypothetical protein
MVFFVIQLFRGLRCSWALEEADADFLGVQVLIDQEVDDDGQLFSNKVFARLLQTRQKVTEDV